MTANSKLMAGLTLLLVPTIQYGGYFLLNVLSGKYAALALTDFQKAMFRAGHAHAGVLVLLSLICQVLADHAGLGGRVEWLVRIGFPVAAILVSGGFFFSVMGNSVTRPNGFIAILFAGVAVLALSLIILGLSLIRNR